MFVEVNPMWLLMFVSLVILYFKLKKIRSYPESQLWQRLQKKIGEMEDQISRNQNPPEENSPDKKAA